MSLSPASGGAEGRADGEHSDGESGDSGRTFHGGCYSVVVVPGPPGDGPRRGVAFLNGVMGPCLTYTGVPTVKRSWYQDVPNNHVGGATVTVNDVEVLITIDHGKSESIRCSFEEYLHEERIGGSINRRDIVRALLTAEETLSVADEVRGRLATRPMKAPASAHFATGPGRPGSGRRAPRWLEPFTVTIGIVLGVVALVLLGLQQWNRGNRQDVFLLAVLAATGLAWGLRRWLR